MKIKYCHSHFGNNIHYLLDTHYIPDIVEVASHDLFAS